MFTKLAITFALAGTAGLTSAGSQRVTLKGIPGELEWKNSPAGFHADDHGFTIEAGKSTDWYISPVDGKAAGNAPILLFEPAEDFVLSAKVTVAFGTQWDAGTLFVYIDDQTWAKLAFEMSVYKKPTIVSVVTRGVSDDCNSWSAAGDSIRLRVARLGKAFAFYASQDGRSWEMIRAFAPGTPARARVGFSAQSPIGPGAQATFTDIAYEARKIKDIFTGE
jgi:regulation of enolase protein 1 (concanavalin A-like superfamily)